MGGEALTFSKRQISDSSKLTELADDNFKFDVNGRKFSKLVENTLGKGKIARNEQFPLFSTRLAQQTRGKQYLFAKGLKRVGWLYWV